MPSLSQGTRKLTRGVPLERAGIDREEYNAACSLADNLAGGQIKELRRRITEGKMAQGDIDRVRQIARDEGVILEALNKSTQLDVLEATQTIVKNAVKMMGYQMEVVERVRKLPGGEGDAVILDSANRAQDLVVKTLKVLSDLHHEGFINVQQNNTVIAGGDVAVSSPELDALIARGVSSMGTGRALQDQRQENRGHRYVRSEQCAVEAPGSGDASGQPAEADRDTGA